VGSLPPLVWCSFGRKYGLFFLRKACSNILPKKENFYKRGISPDPLCPICGSKEETVMHVLWSCPAAMDVLMETSKRFQKWNNEEGSFIDLFERVLERLEEGEVQSFAFVARQVWFRRNQMVFDDEFASPATVNRISTEQKDMYVLAENRPSRRGPTYSYNSSGDQMGESTDWLFEAKLGRVS
jgi:hypothetical protein